jgi:hypothetical protein
MPRPPLKWNAAKSTIGRINLHWRRSVKTPYPKSPTFMTIDEAFCFEGDIGERGAVPARR